MTIKSPTNQGLHGLTTDADEEAASDQVRFRCNNYCVFTNILHAAGLPVRHIPAVCGPRGANSRRAVSRKRVGRENEAAEYGGGIRSPTCSGCLLPPTKSALSL